jgi:hypothetical protein
MSAVELSKTNVLTAFESLKTQIQFLKMMNGGK